MKIAIIRIRGGIRVKKEIKDTLGMLHLYNQNCCVVVEDRPNILGMIKKIKDYVTYGEVDDSTLKLLFEKKGEEFKEKIEDRKGKIKYNKFIIYNNKKYRKYFRLNPPKKGFGRKGIKKSFSKGGALGYRRSKINDLIIRMV